MYVCSAIVNPPPPRQHQGIKKWNWRKFKLFNQETKVHRILILCDNKIEKRNDAEHRK